MLELDPFRDRLLCGVPRWLLRIELRLFRFAIRCLFCRLVPTGRLGGCADHN